MRRVETVAALEALYGQPGEAARAKVTPRLIESHRAWIAQSRFCVIATAGPEGTDASPRGDDGPVATLADERTLLIPDWNGNNRLDTLRNVLRDGRISLMFMVAGSDIVMRVNGSAVVSDDPELTLRFERDGRRPRTVIVVTVSEAYPQCSRALMRAGLWAAGCEAPEALPSLGDMLREATAGGFDGAGFDAGWPARAREGLW